VYSTNLRKVGGSVMLAIPPVLLNLLQLEPGATVAVAVEDGRLVIEPNPRPRHSMTELLAASDYSQPVSLEEREWIDGAAVGGELI
jgi:antitoxin ChpS